MRTIVLLAIVFLAGCDNKKDQTDSQNLSERSSLESTKTPSQELKKAKCFPPFPNIDPNTIPDALEIDCSTQRPVNPEAFHNYRMQLRAQEAAARQQAAQESGDSRMLGIQQLQDNCKYRYPGVFSASNPRAGMCADSLEQISDYQHDQTATQDRINQNEIDSIQRSGVTACRKLCITSSNYNRCMADCY